MGQLRARAPGNQQPQLFFWWKNHVSRAVTIFVRVKANALRACTTRLRVKSNRTPACCVRPSGHAQRVFGLRQIHRGARRATSRLAARDAPCCCTLASGQRTRGSRLLRATFRLAARSSPGSCRRAAGCSACGSGLMRVALRVAARRPFPCGISLMSRVFLALAHFHAWLFPAQTPFTPRIIALSKTL